MPDGSLKLTKSRRDELVRLVASGVRPMRAQAIVGITRGPLSRWCRVDPQFGRQYFEAIAQGQIARALDEQGPDLGPGP